MKYIFGPVPSRRFGNSLGIDIIPKKTCTLDCIFCQIGKTTNLTVKRKPYVPVKPVIKELKKAINSGVKIDYITFSGSGEPTLNTNIGKMIKEIKKITNIPVVVLTNGTLLNNKTVRKDISKADIVAPSLNAVLSCKKVNRPHDQINTNKTVKGLVSFRKEFKGKIWLEIMLVKGINDSRKEIIALKKAISQINPDKIHLNTVVRPPSEKYANPLSKKDMEKIKKFFGEKTEIISRITHAKANLISGNLRGRILQILKRHPARLEDLKSVLKSHSKKISDELNLLLYKKTISRNGKWYKAN